MVGIVLVTHGQLAKELIQTAEFIVGKLAQVESVPIDPMISVEAVREEVAKAIKKVDTGAGVLVLTDMFGGTPSNLSLSFLKENKVEVLTGVNLPMLLKLSTDRDKASLAELAKVLKAYGQKNISLASEILNDRKGKR